MEKTGFKFTVSKYHSQAVVSIEIEDADGRLFFKGNMSTESFGNAVLGMCLQSITPIVVDGKEQP